MSTSREILDIMMNCCMHNIDFHFHFLLIFLLFLDPERLGVAVMMDVSEIEKRFTKLQQQQNRHHGCSICFGAQFQCLFLVRKHLIFSRSLIHFTIIIASTRAKVVCLYFYLILFI